MVEHVLSDIPFSRKEYNRNSMKKALGLLGLRICEKTLYNWIEAGDIPGVSRNELPRGAG